jgi:RimJ/RimL family protein N-acetyltransferase
VGVTPYRDHLGRAGHLTAHPAYAPGGTLVGLTFCWLDSASEDHIRAGPARRRSHIHGLLAGEIWPFHSGGPIDAEAVTRRVANGEYNTASVHTYWIVVDGERCGFVKAFEVDDGTPLFDLRVAATHRGRGIGTAALVWLIAYLFDLLPGINRVE